MNGILIANKDQAAREEMARLFHSDSYRVTLTDSVANALEGILDKSIQVVLLSGSFDEQYVARFVPLMKKCNRKLSIILVSDDMPLDLLRRVRKEGIFYHALKPAGEEGWEEICQAVDCAFESYHAQQNSARKNLGTLAFQGAKTILSSMLVWLVMSPQAYAMDAAGALGGGLLMILFVGFFALLFALQLVPALLALAGKTEEAAKVYEGTLVSSSQETSD